MRRGLVVLPGCCLALLTFGAAPSYAAGGDPGPAPDSCFEPNANGDLPTCTSDGGPWVPTYDDSSPPDGVPGSFIGFVVLAMLVGGGFTIYKVTMARRLATDSGMDPGQATAMTLLNEDGLAATYLAANLRSSTPAAPAAAAHRSASERLAELQQLKDAGTLTEAEYAERRKAIVDSI
jgi:hypothetical protein